MPHNKLAAIGLIHIKYVNDRIQEARQQTTAGTQHTKRFAPHGAYGRHKAVRHRMKNQIEAFARELRQVGHIAFNQLQR